MDILRRRGALAGFMSLLFLAAMLSLFIPSDAEKPVQNDADFAAYESALETDASALPKELSAPALETAPDAMPTQAQHAANPIASVGQQPALAHAAPADEPVENPPTEPTEKAPIWDPDSVESTDPLPDDWQPAIPREAITEALEGIKPNIQQCYDTLLQEFPEAAGLVRIRFIFHTEDGLARVQLSEIVEPTTLLNSDLHDCMSETVGSIELPRAANDTQVMIIQRFQFHPDQGVILVSE